MSSRRPHRGSRQHDRRSAGRTGAPVVAHLVPGDAVHVRVAKDVRRLARGARRSLVLEVVEGPSPETVVEPTPDGLRLVRPALSAGAVHGDAEFDRRLAEVLLERGVHVLHVHAVDPLAGGPRVLEVAYHLGIPSVMTLHDVPSMRPDLLRDRTWSAALGFADVLTGTSERVLRDAAQHAWWPAARARLGLLSPAADSRWAELYRLLAGELSPVPGEQLLSVVVSTYERPEALRACLESLTRSVLPPERFEVVVVDDAGVPEAAPVVAEFGGRLPVRHVRHEHNQGLGQARNTGVREATGDVVLLLDDDDVVGPRCLAEHLRAHVADSDPWLAVLGFTGLVPALLADPVMHSVTAVGQQYFGYRSLTEGDELPWNFLWGGRTSLKRATLLRERFETHFVEDTDLAWRLRHRLRVVYRRHAVQAVSVGLGARGFLGRSSKMGAATQQFVARHADAELTEAFGMSDGPRLASLESGAPAALAVLDLLASADLSTLRGTVLAEPVAAQVRAVLAALAGPRMPARAYAESAADAVDVALALCGTYERLVGYLAAERQSTLQAPLTVLALPDWTDEASLRAPLDAFARAFRPGDPALLRLGLSGLEPEQALDRAAALLVALGHDLDRLPAIEITPYEGQPPSADFWLSCRNGPPRPRTTLPVPSVDVVDGLRRLTGAGSRTRALR